MNTINAEVRGALILVVDDDEAMRLLLRAGLERSGFAVVEAENGRQALGLFDTAKPDVVLLDVVMPGMNGYEVCVALRRTRLGEHVPILMVTGANDLESIQHAYDVGATDFVTKGTSWLVLSERVRYILRASRAAEQLRTSEARLAKAQHIASLGSWELDLTRDKFHCSDETYSICGLQARTSAINFLDLVDCTHPDDRAHLQNAMSDAIHLGVSRRFDHRIILPDGRERIVSQHLEAIGSEGDFTHQVAGTIQDITERKQAELLELDRNRVLEMVIRSEPLKDILHQSVLMVEHQRPDALCSMSLVQGDRLVVGAAPKLPGPFVQALDGRLIDPKGGCCSAAAYFGQIMVAPDIATSPIWENCQQLALNHGLRAAFSVPVISGKGQILGTITIYYDRPYGPTAADCSLLEMVSKLTAIAVEQRQLHKRLAHQAHHDALTGLPNRLLLEDRLEHALSRALRHGKKVGLVYIDLDRFKHINDSLGHHAGDQILQQVAERLTHCTRQSDTLARMGGDEFMVVLNAMEHEEDAALSAARILESLKAPFSLEGRELHINASIGISVYPEDAQDAATLQRNADISMYYAKNQGGDRYQYFLQEMNAVLIERLELENELRKALERREFELHYQPQYELNGKILIGVEALLRWSHPEFGRILPGKFIPIAEETGLIVPIGTWVLREACRRNMSWQLNGHSPFKVAVNVSVVQLLQANFVDTVAQVLQETGLLPKWLELEVTESVLMKDLNLVAKRLTELRSLGVSIAIDDFGSGYSSMAYLQCLPVDTLKIDQSFVKDIESLGSSSQRSRSLMKAFVGLACSLGVKLLAEGVESPEQHRFLREIGCELGQGFLLDVPMEAQEIELLCGEGSPARCAAK